MKDVTKQLEAGAARIIATTPASVDLRKYKHSYMHTHLKNTYEAWEKEKNKTTAGSREDTVFKYLIDLIRKEMEKHAPGA